MNVHLRAEGDDEGGGGNGANGGGGANGGDEADGGAYELCVDCWIALTRGACDWPFPSGGEYKAPLSASCFRVHAEIAPSVTAELSRRIQSAISPEALQSAASAAASRPPLGAPLSEAAFHLLRRQDPPKVDAQTLLRHQLGGSRAGGASDVRAAAAGGCAVRRRHRRRRCRRRRRRCRRQRGRRQRRLEAVSLGDGAGRGGLPRARRRLAAHQHTDAAAIGARSVRPRRRAGGGAAAYVGVAGRPSLLDARQGAAARQEAIGPRGAVGGPRRRRGRRLVGVRQVREVAAPVGTPWPVAGGVVLRALARPDA